MIYQLTCLDLSFTTAWFLVSLTYRNFARASPTDCEAEDHFTWGWSSGHLPDYSLVLVRHWVMPCALDPGTLEVASYYDSYLKRPLIVALCFTIVTLTKLLYEIRLVEVGSVCEQSVNYCLSFRCVWCLDSEVYNSVDALFCPQHEPKGSFLQSSGCDALCRPLKPEACMVSVLQPAGQVSVRLQTFTWSKRDSSRRVWLCMKPSALHLSKEPLGFL